MNGWGDIIGLARKGDRNALGQLASRYLPHYGDLLCDCSECDLDDILRHGVKIRTVGQLDRYVATSMRHARNREDSFQKKRVLISIELTARSRARKKEKEECPQIVSMSNEYVRTVRQKISELPAEEREAVSSWMAGKKCDRNKFFRAKQRLRPELEKIGI